MLLHSKFCWLDSLSPFTADHFSRDVCLLPCLLVFSLFHFVCVYRFAISDVENFCFVTFSSDTLSLPTEVTEFDRDSNGSSSFSEIQVPQTYFVYYTGQDINGVCVCA